MVHKTRTKALSILLSLALVLGLMPGMSLTAYADNTETLLTTITATAKEQASYSTEGVATVSFSYTANGSSNYLASWGWWGYGWTATVTAAEGYTITKCVFYDNENHTATDSEAPFVVETTEEDKTPKVNGAIFGGNTSKGITKIEVYGYAAPATDTTSYTLTIPSTLTVANSGWNATDGISATGALASGKKLTVTATSANGWALKSGDNSVSYTLTTAEGGSQTTSWEFTTLDGTAKPMGIIVEDYSSKPVGTYTDTVTFTASVGNAAPPQYANQLREASKYTGDFDDAGFWDWSNDGLDGKTITVAEAQALAAYQKQQTGSSCAVFYDGNESRDSGYDSTLYYVKDDGTTGVVWWGDNIAGTALNGYKLYVVNK